IPARMRKGRTDLSSGRPCAALSSVTAKPTAPARVAGMGCDVRMNVRHAADLLDDWAKLRVSVVFPPKARQAAVSGTSLIRISKDLARTQSRRDGASVLSSPSLASPFVPMPQLRGSGLTYRPVVAAPLIGV